MHRQHSWRAIIKSFSTWDCCFLGSSSCEGDTSWWLLCHSCCPSESHPAQCQTALARNTDRSRLAPTSVGAEGWFGMLPAPHSQILLHFYCHPSVSLATLPAAQPPMHCVCATPSSYTPCLIFWGFSVYILLCFPMEIVPLIQTMSLLCCQMNSWMALSGLKSRTNNQALFSHTVS